MSASELDFLPIETEQLLLRIPTPADAILMLRYVTDNTSHLAPWEPARSSEYYTVAFWKTTLIAYQQQCANNRALRLILLLKGQPHGPIIGCCNFNNIIRGAFQACYLGYSIDARYQGRGLMYEALTAALEAIFIHMRLHRVMANYMPGNERSGKLLRKLGFVPEGYARDYLKIAGKWEDHILTALVRTMG